MDIQLLGKDSLKIKSKKTTVAVDPRESVSKFDADAVLIIDKESDATRVNNSRITINGAGEYEVAGLKITGITTDGDLMYVLNSENVDTVVARASSFNKFSTDKIGEYKIAVINVDAELNQSLVTAMEPRLVVLYGDRAKEGARALGKESASVSSKISVAEEKLPEEMDVMLLG